MIPNTPKASPALSGEREALAAKLDAIANTLQYGCNGQWGAETIGPIREAIAALSPAQAGANPAPTQATAREALQELVSLAESLLKKVMFTTERAGEVGATMSRARAVLATTRADGL